MLNVADVTEIKSNYVFIRLQKNRSKQLDVVYDQYAVHDCRAYQFFVFIIHILFNIVLNR